MASMAPTHVSASTAASAGKEEKTSPEDKLNQVLDWFTFFNLPLFAQHPVGVGVYRFLGMCGRSTDARKVNCTMTSVDSIVQVRAIRDVVAGETLTVHANAFHPFRDIDRLMFDMLQSESRPSKEDEQHIRGCREVEFRAEYRRRLLEFTMMAHDRGRQSSPEWFVNQIMTCLADVLDLSYMLFTMEHEIPTSAWICRAWLVGPDRLELIFSEFCEALERKRRKELSLIASSIGQPRTTI
jgi:hypothetical protein